MTDTTELRAVVAKAYEAGAMAVHVEWRDNGVYNRVYHREPDFWDAAGDYADSVMQPLADYNDRLRAELKQEDAQVMGMQDAYLAAIAERDAARAELAAANDERARLREALVWAVDAADTEQYEACWYAAARAALTETNNAG